MSKAKSQGKWQNLPTATGPQASLQPAEAGAQGQPPLPPSPQMFAATTATEPSSPAHSRHLLPSSSINSRLNKTSSDAAGLELHSKMEAAAARFFSCKKFAVVGASQDPGKFGYKILVWYHTHRLPVFPVNPSRKTIDVPSKSYDTVPSVSALHEPSETGVSFLTPPPITRQILQEAKNAGVKAVWLQPGSFDNDGMKYAGENFESAVMGYEDGTVGGEGWCVLVDGESSMQRAGRQSSRQRL